MSRYAGLILLFVAIISFSAAVSRAVDIVVEGKPTAQIVLPDGPTATEKFAATSWAVKQ